MRSREQFSYVATNAAPRAVTDDSGYRMQRAYVDAAYQRMHAISLVPHAPADARNAATELTAALRQANATATRLLRQSQLPNAPRRRRHREVAQVVAPGRWSGELVWLTDIAAWLSRIALDDLGVHIPTTVRVGNYAATGPHIPGLDFDTDDAAEECRPRIGVDLRAVVDGIHQGATATGPIQSPLSVPALAA